MIDMISIFKTQKPRMYIRGSAARRGFSFAEVMFAVVILGIGFIMVAAVFPVAIQQTQATGEENIAAALARQAADSISQMPTTLKNPVSSAVYFPNPLPTVSPPPAVSIPTEYVFPPTVKDYVLGDGTIPNAVPPAPIVVPFVGSRWDLLKSNVILPTDPRFAYVMFYKRASGSSVAQVIVVAVAARNHPTYQANNDLFNYSSPATVSINTTPSNFPAAKPQTIICPDTLTGPTTPNFEGATVQVPITSLGGPVMGRSYTLGRFEITSRSWELMPADDMAITAGSNGQWGTAGQLADPVCSSVLANLNPPATLQPTVGYAKLFMTPDAPQGRILINSVALHSGNVPAGAVQGAYIIIADDFPPLPPMSAGGANYALQPNVPAIPPTSISPGVPGYAVGAMNGRIFRLGAPVPASAAIEAGTFNLDPAYPMSPIPPGQSSSPDAIPNQVMLNNISSIDADKITLNSIGAAKVYIIGAGRTNPTTPTNTSVSGPAQDIGVFTSFFQVQ